MRKVCIGISGWTYPGWKKVFYPKGLPRTKELNYASTHLNSLEINGTFYSLQKPSSFKSWYDQTPEGFVFAVKGGQFITHVRRLKDIEGPLAFFFGSGILELKEKLGPVLWQFPPNVMLKDDRFEKFLKLLPKTTTDASRIMERHRDRLRYPEQIESAAGIPIRHAFEFRHPSFFNPDFFALLRAHGAAIVHAHAAPKCPYTEEITSDFIYVRLHGEGKAYKKGYPTKELLKWQEKIESHWRGRDVFLYFSTDAKEFAPKGAVELSNLIQTAPPRMRAA